MPRDVSDDPAHVDLLARSDLPEPDGKGSHQDDGIGDQEQGVGGREQGRGEPREGEREQAVVGGEPEHGPEALGRAVRGRWQAVPRCAEPRRLRACSWALPRRIRRSESSQPKKATTETARNSIGTATAQAPASTPGTPQRTQEIATAPWSRQILPMSITWSSHSPDGLTEFREARQLAVGRIQGVAEQEEQGHDQGRGGAGLDEGQDGDAAVGDQGADGGDLIGDEPELGMRRLRTPRPWVGSPNGSRPAPPGPTSGRPAASSRPR